MKILVVEDEKYSRLSILKQLASISELQDISLLSAEDGKQGLEVFLTENPEIVLSDIKMPDMNGLEMMAEILKAKPDTKVLLISGYAEFQFAQTALNQGAAGYLLKPIKTAELSYHVCKQIHAVKDSRAQTENLEFLIEDESITHYIYNLATSKSQNTDSMKDTIFQKLFSPYLFVVFFFQFEEAPSRSQFLCSIKQICMEHHVSEMRMITIVHNTIGMVLRKSKQVNLLLHTLQDYCVQEYHNCYLGVSAPHETAQELSVAYEQALFAVRHKFFYSAHVLYYESLIKKRKNIRELDENTMQLIGLYLRLGDTRRCTMTLRQIFSTLNADDTISLSTYETLLMRLRVLLHETNSHVGLAGEFDALNIRFYIIDYDSSDQMVNALCAAVAHVCENVQRCTEAVANPQDVVQIVVNYINENYSHDISLQKLAENVLFMNPSYLSFLIKERLHTTYSQYLKQVRMEKARAYLSRDDITVTEVASLCGYNDTSQFITVFKKENGVTPKRYQQEHAKWREPEKTDLGSD